MRTKKYLVISLLIFSLIASACSHSEPIPTAPGTIVFQGSTPGDDLIKSLLTIPANSKVDFIRWNLTLNTISSNRSAFSLSIVFGEVQQNSLGFKGGGSKLSIKGEYKISEFDTPNLKGTTYHLKSNQLPSGIMLYRVNDNLMQIMETPDILMNGNAGWSYTLNRLNPVISSLPEFEIQSPASQLLTDNSDTTSVFQGRTLCNPFLLSVNGISASGCNRIKWELTLNQDSKTHLPTTFLLKAIYVGMGDVVYTQVGNWETGKAKKTNSESIVYLLKLRDSKDPENLVFVRGDNNILFFLDNGRNLLIGNGDHSFTLNRKIK
jgi:hypothetical protein